MSKDIPALRAAIDELDDELLRLFNKRCGYVLQVGAIKKQEQQPDICYVRAGREADMVRRVYEASKEGNFPAVAAAHMWRIIIAASLSLESPLTVTAYAPEANQEIYWLAREYFGNFTPMAKEPTARRVLGEVMDGKSQIAALPLPDDSAEGKWWLKLPDNLKIFACIPFVLPKGAAIKSLAVARLEPEETGNDVSLFSIEVQNDISQSRLKAVLDRYELAARWLTVESFASGHRAHLIELKGFHTINSDFVQSLKQDMTTSLLAIKALGSYALPITL